MMKKNRKFLSLLLFVLAALSSCEKVDLEKKTPKGEGFLVSVNVQNFDHLGFTPMASDKVSAAGAKALPLSRAVVPVRDVCTHLNLAAYKNGTKVFSDRQTSDDKNFGQMQFRLPAGKYYVVIIGHSSPESVSMTDFRKVSFGGKVTDTYFFTHEIEVDDDLDFNATMVHCVSKIEFVMEDAVPKEATHIKFSYTGGSSTLDVVDGVGVTKSQQKEDRVVSEEAHKGSSSYALYTFPREEKSSIKLEVTALDDKNQVVLQRSFENIPVELNSLTRFSGRFFKDKDNDFSIGATIKADNEWKKILNYTY